MGPNFGNNVNVYETIGNNIGASGILRLQFKAGAESQPKGCSACFVLVIEWSAGVFADHGALINENVCPVLK